MKKSLFVFLALTVCALDASRKIRPKVNKVSTEPIILKGTLFDHRHIVDKDGQSVGYTLFIEGPDKKGMKITASKDDPNFGTKPLLLKAKHFQPGLYTFKHCLSAPSKEDKVVPCLVYKLNLDPGTNVIDWKWSGPPPKRKRAWKGIHIEEPKENKAKDAKTKFVKYAHPDKKKKPVDIWIPELINKYLSLKFCYTTDQGPALFVRPSDVKMVKMKGEKDFKVEKEY